MDFKAEIIRTSQRKLITNDNQFEVVFRTDNPMILDLGKLPADTLVDVKVNIQAEPKAQEQTQQDESWGPMKDEPGDDGK